MVTDNTKKASNFKKAKRLEIGQWVRISTPAFYTYIKAIDKSLLTKKLLVVKWTPQKFEIVSIIKGKTDMQNDKYKLKDENGRELEKTFFKSDLKLTTPYNKREARRGIYSYHGVKELDIKLNPKTNQAPTQEEGIVNRRDQQPTRRTTRSIQRQIQTEPESRERSSRRARKYKIDDFKIGDRVNVKYDTAKSVYDNETDRWIFKDSPLFENVEIEDINDDENDQFPLYIDYGNAYQDNERYDFIKLSQVKKIYR